MNYLQSFDYWNTHATDEEVVADLQRLADEADDSAVEDAFYRNLEFGTAGLRGVLGAGTNRMNIYTVGQATQGLADWVNSVPGKAGKVAICYDSRINSELFARTAAGVLAANGIVAYVYPRLEPTPALSYAVRALGCDAGINVTASHNPAQYNGYKAYGPDGCQITSDAAAAISASIEHVDPFTDVKSLSFEDGLAQDMIVLTPETVLDGFLDAVFAQSVGEDTADSGDLRVVYTPLNGTGLECVTRILERIGVTDIHVVPEQAEPDGNFPTCTYPNPENRAALERGIALCEQVHPDLLVATDPDADRVGIAVKDGDEYQLLTGNELGVLLLDFVCRSRVARSTMPANPVAVTTIVSTDMVDSVAAAYGVEVRRVLTGFKYIGEQIALLEEDGHPERFVFGFEESYGYLSGPHVRDKDAINATMLICEAARYYRKQGMNLYQAMQALYAEHGVFANESISFAFEGSAGAQKMSQIMNTLRTQPPSTIGGFAVTSVTDYDQGVNGLPKANVVQFDLETGQKAIVRPSGTEPKIKVYVSAHASDAAQAADIESRIGDDMSSRLA